MECWHFRIWKSLPFHYAGRRRIRKRKCPCECASRGYHRHGFTHNPTPYGKILHRRTEAFCHRHALGGRILTPLRLFGIVDESVNLGHRAHVDHPYRPHSHRHGRRSGRSLFAPSDVPVSDSRLVQGNVSRYVRIAPPRYRRDGESGGMNRRLDDFLAYFGCRRVLRLRHRRGFLEILRGRAGTFEIALRRFGGAQLFECVPESQVRHSKRQSARGKNDDDGRSSGRRKGEPCEGGRNGGGNANCRRFFEIEAVSLSVSDRMGGKEKQRHLGREGHRRRADERVVGDYEHVSHQIERRDGGIDLEKPLLFSGCNEEVGEKRRQEVKEEYERHHPHRVRSVVPGRSCHEVVGVRDEFDDRLRGDREVERGSGSEEEKYRVRFFYQCRNLLRAAFDRGREEREHRVEEHRSEHHSHFDDLHGDPVERDVLVRRLVRFEKRKEYDVDLEEYDVQKERQAVGKRGRKHVFGVLPVEYETDFLHPSRICVQKPGHHDVAEKSAKHDGSERERWEKQRIVRSEPGMAYCGLGKDEGDDGDDRKQVRHLAERGRDEGEFGLKVRLQERKDGRIHQPEEREHSGDEDSDERRQRVVAG